MNLPDYVIIEKLVDGEWYQEGRYVFKASDVRAAIFAAFSLGKNYDDVRVIFEKDGQRLTI